MNRAYGNPNGFGVNFIRHPQWQDSSRAMQSLLPGVPPPGAPGHRVSVVHARATYGPGGAYGPSGAEGLDPYGPHGRGSYKLPSTAGVPMAVDEGARRRRLVTALGLGAVVLMVLGG